MKLIITESQFRNLTEQFYDPEKLYDKKFIVSSLMKAPRYMRKYIKGLDDDRECYRGDVQYACTRIPQVVYQYLFGNF
jgi:hypothetical protein